MNATGYATYEVSLKPGSDFWKPSLTSEGLFTTPKDFILEQCLIRLESLLNSITTLPLDGAIIELPEVVYAGNKSPKAILSQASAILETAMVATLFWKMMRAKRVPTAFIRPRQWQVGNGKPRKVNSKVWSTTSANAILDRFQRNRKLHSKLDENIADAITMGWMLMEKIFLGEIAFS